MPKITVAGVVYEHLHITGLIKKITKDCPNVRIASSVVLGNNVAIEGKCSIGAYTQISDNVTIGHGVTIGPKCKIGSGARVDAHVHIYTNVVLDKYVWIQYGTQIRDKVTIGEQTVVAQHVVIDPSTKIGCRGHIDKHTTIGTRVRVGNYTRIGSDCTIVTRSRVGSMVSIGNQCVVHQGCKIENNLTICTGTRLITGGVISVNPFYVQADLPYVFNGYGDLIQIGCRTYTIDEWLYKYKQVATEAYICDPVVIKKYLRLIKQYKAWRDIT